MEAPDEAAPPEVTYDSTTGDVGPVLPLFDGARTLVVVGFSFLGREIEVNFFAVGEDEAARSSSISAIGVWEPLFPASNLGDTGDDCWCGYCSPFAPACDSRPVESLDRPLRFMMELGVTGAI